MRQQCHIGQGSLRPLQSPEPVRSPVDLVTRFLVPQGLIKRLQEVACAGGNDYKNEPCPKIPAGPSLSLDGEKPQPFRGQQNRPCAKIRWPKKINHWQPELALCRVDNQAMILKSLKHKFEV